jgi:hypothetical protein
VTFLKGSWGTHHHILYNSGFLDSAQHVPILEVERCANLDPPPPERRLGDLKHLYFPGISRGLVGKGE